MAKDDGQGRAARGQVHKGQAPLKQVAGYKSTSSIPAKFETVLFTGPREKKGFMSESKRFMDSETEQPGPGAYTQQQTLEYQHDSISKKGYSGMASKTKRFSNRIYYTGPGPGEYKFTVRGDAASFSQAPASASFMPKTTAPRKPREPDEPPGPGTYASEGVTRTGQQLDYTAKRPGAGCGGGATSAFKAVPHQLVLSGNLDAPPPTAYDLGDPWAGGRAYSATGAGSRGAMHGGGGGGGSSSFGGTAGGRSVASLASMLTDINKLVFGGGVGGSGDHNGSGANAGGGFGATPGPGQYELQDFASIRSKVAKGAGRPSAPFAPVEFVDRFGRPHGDRPQLETTRAQPDAFAPNTRVRSPQHLHETNHASSSQPQHHPSPHPLPSHTQPSSSSSAAAPTAAVAAYAANATAAVIPSGSSQSPSAHHSTGASAAPAGRLSSPSKGVGAPFRSRSAGHQEYAEQSSYAASSNAPGPAYYNASLPPGKKSFHLNARKRFA